MAMNDLPATLHNFAAVVEEPASKKRKKEAEQKVTVPDWCFRAIEAQAFVVAMGKPAVTWTIQECFAKQIFEGQKVYEGVSATKRLADKLYVGCEIGFHWYRPVTVTAKVVSLQKFDSARDMLETLGPHLFLPFEGSGEEGVLERCVKVYDNLRIKGPMLAIGLDEPKLKVKPNIDIATFKRKSEQKSSSNNVILTHMTMTLALLSHMFLNLKCNFGSDFTPPPQIVFVRLFTVGHGIARRFACLARCFACLACRACCTQDTTDPTRQEKEAILH